jgi:GNAT superfamily N-acetyltransferase
MSDEENTPPEKIRITGLQEAQLKDLKRIESRCAQMFYEIGLSEEQVAPRSDMEIARLSKDHDLMIAEADHEPAGYLAWADEAPGVAWLPIIMVDPESQRFGIGTHLLRGLGDAAGKLGIGYVVTPCWERATFTMAFLAVRGFQPLEDGLPSKLAAWAENRAADVAKPGQRLWWASTDGLGTIPGLPRPEPAPNSGY